MKAAIYVPLHPERLVPLAAFDEAVRSIEELRERWPGCATGVRADRARMLVIDIDTKRGAPGVATIRGLQARIGELPPTRTHRTKSGGWHLLYRAIDGVRSAQGTLRGAGLSAPGVDIVAARAVIRWVPGTPGYALARDLPVADLPERWASALADPPEDRANDARALPTEDGPARRYALAALRAEGIELAETAALRNCRLTRAAASLGQLMPALSESEIYDVLLVASEQNGSLKEHGRRACEKTIARGIRWGRAHTRSAV